MDKDRKAHIDWCLDSETNDPETQEWRDELTPEERAYADQQDGCYEQAVAASGKVDDFPTWRRYAGLSWLPSGE